MYDQLAIAASAAGFRVHTQTENYSL